MSEISWPPAYTLKRHARARHVKFKASSLHGLEVVVPLRFSLKHLPGIFEENRLWIEKRLLEIQAASLLDTHAMPDVLHLRALEQSWSIHYVKSDNKKLKLMVLHQQELVLVGDTTDTVLCKKLLSNWIKKQGHGYLVKLLNSVSEQTGLSYKSVSIRGQRSRWGSCTSDKAISLNFKLMFMPPELVKHIIIHELCHTLHMNHSAKFWRLVASFDPAWKQHCREVRRSEGLVPGWV